jgi:hypothetical protein
MEISNYWWVGVETIQRLFSREGIVIHSPTQKSKIILPDKTIQVETDSKHVDAARRWILTRGFGSCNELPVVLVQLDLSSHTNPLSFLGNEASGHQDHWVLVVMGAKNGNNDNHDFRSSWTIRKANRVEKLGSLPRMGQARSGC